MDNKEQPEIDMAFVEQTRTKVMKVDIAIGLISIAPLASFLWGFAQDERFSLEAMGILGMLYAWSVGACYLLLLRRIKDKGLRWTALLFASGTFASMLVFSFSFLPHIWALASVPVGTFFISRLRTRLHKNTDMLLRLGQAHQKQGKLHA